MEARVRTSDKFRLHLNSASFRPFSVIITPLTGMQCGDVGDKMMGMPKILYSTPHSVQVRHRETVEKCEAMNCLL